MDENATGSDLVISGIDSLEVALARHRTVPEYTMQAVAQQTGVPPDTLRSWERRYSFPAPARTDSNRRLYSSRDIAAVHWLRDQTGLGQGISEAIHMLLAHIGTVDDSTPALSPEPPTMLRTSQQLEVPVETLENALSRGRMDDAQSAWDHLAIAVSPEALTNNVIMPIYHRIQISDITHQARHQALAFLLRKATVLLDHTGPDRGTRKVCIAIAGRVESTLPASVLATVLSRAGYHILMPIMDISTIETIDMIRQISPDIVIVVADTGASRSSISAFARLLPDQRLYGWTSTGASSFPDPIETLPDSLFEIPTALKR